MRHSLVPSLVLAVLTMSACQVNRPAGVLQIVPVEEGERPADSPARPPIERSISHLEGTALYGKSPLGGAEVVAKDALTGSLLGETTTEADGGFRLPVALPPSAALVQVVVVEGARTVQALIALDDYLKTAAFRVATTDSSAAVTVDWTSTLLAKALGIKLAEVFLAVGEERAAARDLLLRSATLAEDAEAATLEEFERKALAQSAFREAVTEWLTDANEQIVSAFRAGRGPVFEPRAIDLAGLRIKAPKVVLDRDAGKIRITVGGKDEVLAVSPAAWSRASDVDLSAIASLISAPSTSSHLPSTITTGVPADRGSRGRSSGSSSSPHGTFPRDHAMWVDDVVLAETGESILGPDAPAALSYTPEGQIVRLTLKGRLNADHPPTLGQSDYAYPGFPSEGFIQQTFIGKKPLRRVLLDDSIWLPLDPQAPLTDTELTVVLDTRGLTDLAISRLHRLAVIDREDEANVQIRVGNTSLPGNLQPIITKVEPVGNVKFRQNGRRDETDGGHHSQAKNEGGGNPAHHFSLLQHEAGHVADEADAPKYLRVEGLNLPTSIYPHWAQVNGVRVYAHATWITDEEQPRSILFLHLPEDLTIKVTGQNTLSYANPFGFKFMNF